MSLISRNHVMLAYLNNLGTKDSYKAKYEALVKAVDESPVVEAVPVVHARWGKPVIDGYDGLHIKYANPCSACNYTSRVYGRFCPHCGARMDEKEGISES